MSESQYWVAVPGSDEPPLGPLDLGEVIARLKANTIPRDATVCRVGAATWLPIASVLPSPPVAPPAVPTNAANPVPLNEAGSEHDPLVEKAREGGRIERKYANLTSVGEGVRSYGTFIKAVGFAGGAGGGFVWLIISEDISEHSKALATPSVILVVLNHRA